MRLIVSVFVLHLLGGGIESKAVLEDNGYSEFVVAISPDVPQDDNIIQEIKNMLIEMSREMYTATRLRAYLRSVKILLPKTWSLPDTQPIENESFETAEFRIDNPNTAYGESPYTLQTTDCGVPGLYTHLTPTFVRDGTQYGNKGKTLVHEFAKLRWGVFEEHGYPGDDKFPMYYMKAVWSPSGQNTVVTPNFCINGELRGYEQDIKDGGACKTDASGLPDANCIFFATHDTMAESSYMALPYLTSVTDFCDATEDRYHDTQIPTKQNLYCNGQSTWAIIHQNPDFAGAANPANPNITNTDPEFILVGGAGESSSLKYVLVADVSHSMVEKERFIPMKNAAKRWIGYDLSDDVSLGLVLFNELTEIGFNMTKVKDGRQMMINTIDKVNSSGQTCISCGLLTAASSEELLNNQAGVIVLLTDGKQNANGGVPSIDDAADVLVKNKVRVITIALGDEADSAIEDLAEKTGGKSFYVEDNSGPSDFNNAFSGSTTYQPGDTLGETDVTIYQKDWISQSEKKYQDVFEIDSSLGRNLTFRLEFTKSKTAVSECSQEMNITFINPNAEKSNEKFKCSKDNFGIFNKMFEEGAPSGRWLYTIETDESFESMSIKITSKSRDEGTDPILTRCWINTGSQVLNGDIQIKLAAVAEVRQGNMPVIGANVKAYIEVPQQSGDTMPALELDLFDNGSGADSIQNDGIYTRYFTKYTGSGRYSVKCEVTGGDDTQVNEGFIVDRSIPMSPIETPMCCGSNAVRPDSKLTKTGNFSRQSVGGSFSSDSVVYPLGDVYPPSRVLDLKVPNPPENMGLMFTSPGDDLDSEEPVASYTIRYALRANNLTEHFEANSQLDASHLSGGSLDPAEGGTLVTLKLDESKFESGNLYFFGMTATDEAGNESPVSNIVSFCLECDATYEPATTSSTSKPSTSTAQPSTSASTSTSTSTYTSTSASTSTPTYKPSTTATSTSKSGTSTAKLSTTTQPSIVTTSKGSMNCPIGFFMILLTTLF